MLSSRHFIVTLTMTMTMPMTMTVLTMTLQRGILHSQKKSTCTLNQKHPKISGYHVPGVHRSKKNKNSDNQTMHVAVPSASFHTNVNKNTAPTIIIIINTNLQQKHPQTFPQRPQSNVHNVPQRAQSLTIRDTFSHQYPHHYMDRKTPPCFLGQQETVLSCQ